VPIESAFDLEWLLVGEKSNGVGKCADQLVLLASPIQSFRTFVAASTDIGGSDFGFHACEIVRAHYWLKMFLGLSVDSNQCLCYPLRSHLFSNYFKKVYAVTFDNVCNHISDGHGGDTFFVL